MIMMAIIQTKEEDIEKLKEKCKDKENFFETLQELVNSHILRYTINETVKFHNKIIENYFVKECL